MSQTFMNNRCMADRQCITVIHVTLGTLSIFVVRCTQISLCCQVNSMPVVVLYGLLSQYSLVHDWPHHLLTIPALCKIQQLGHRAVLPDLNMVTLVSTALFFGCLSISGSLLLKQTCCPYGRGDSLHQIGRLCPRVLSIRARPTDDHDLKFCYVKL